MRNDVVMYVEVAYDNFGNKRMYDDDIDILMTHISSRCIAALWNSLLSDIQSSPSLPVFRQRLKTFLLYKSSFTATR